MVGFVVNKECHLNRTKVYTCSPVEYEYDFLMNIIIHTFQCNSFEKLLYSRAQPSQVG
jgi:hypothetical protein